MHEDECYTYFLSNCEKSSGLSFSFEDGVKHNSQDCFDEYLYADDFNIAAVWHNQKNDVHPPFYYLLFHIFGLLTHYFWGMKTGILLNVFFHIGNVLLVYSILKKLLQRVDICLLGCGVYAMMPIVLGNILFIRMYALLSTFVLLLTVCMLNGLKKGMDRWFYVSLCGISIGGVLTHYYFLVYLFYSCCVCGILLLLSRSWKRLLCFIGTMCCAGGMSIVIFPAMLQHMFEGYRGSSLLIIWFTLPGENHCASTQTS